MKPSSKGILYAGFTTLLWGVLGIMIKVASHSIDTFSLIWIRFLIAFLCIFPFYIFKETHQLRIFVRPPRSLVIAGVLLLINYIAFMRGVELTSPSNAQVLGQAGPVFLVFLGFAFLKERLFWQQFVGMLTAVLGFFLFFHDQTQGILFNTDSYSQGVIWITTSSLAWAIYAIVTKTLVRQYDPNLLTMYMYGLGVLLLTPFVNFSVFSQQSYGDWLLILFLGVNTFLSYGALSHSFKYLNASTVGMITSLSPVLCVSVMSILSGFNLKWVDPEIINSQGYLGAVFTVVGAVLVVKFQKESKIGLKETT